MSFAAAVLLWLASTSSHAALIRVEADVAFRIGATQATLVRADSPGVVFGAGESFFVQPGAAAGESRRAVAEAATYPRTRQ